jgi:hypothetical protein
MNEIGIGILLYDELENAKRLLEDIQRLQIKGIDFYFFDNGSKSQAFSSWITSIDSENIKVLRVDSNLGFGGGAKYILENIPNNIRGYMPGNYKVRPKSLVNLSSKINKENKLEVFKATRSGRTISENLKTLAVGLATSLYFGTNIMDSGGTPTLVSSELVEIFKAGPDDYSFEAFLLFTSQKLNLKIQRAPIEYGLRIHGNSHWQSGFKSEIKLFLRIIEQKQVWKNMLINYRKELQD